MVTLTLCTYTLGRSVGRFVGQSVGPSAGGSVGRSVGGLQWAPRISSNTCSSALGIRSQSRLALIRFRVRFTVKGGMIIYRSVGPVGRLGCSVRFGLRVSSLGSWVMGCGLTDYGLGFTL